LRQALTPDDHVTIVVDEGLSDLPRFLTPILEHIARAHVLPETVTFLRRESASTPDWLERLPEAFRQIKVEDHDPHHRKRLSYLATTKHGRRVYLNRTAVDADQLVVVSRRCYDPLLGRGGAEGAVFPALGDADTQEAVLSHLSTAPADSATWPVRAEAAEICWLLGAPFFVQVIEDHGSDVSGVLAGPIAASAEGDRLQDARWRLEVDEPATTVVAQVSGDPDRHTFADLARALACAGRVVRPEGRIILVSGGLPDIDAAGQLLRQTDTPAEALALLKEQHPPDRAAAFQWAESARHANLYLLSRLPGDLVEELFAVPLDNPHQVERMVGDAPYLYLHDADRTLAVVRP
jgi:nickel-dependent lactate racemase